MRDLYEDLPQWVRDIASRWAVTEGSCNPPQQEIQQLIAYVQEVRFALRACDGFMLACLMRDPGSEFVKSIRKELGVVLERNAPPEVK